jgi:hypothetical protein
LKLNSRRIKMETQYGERPDAFDGWEARYRDPTTLLEETEERVMYLRGIEEQNPQDVLRQTTPNPQYR